jgi:uncharacterized membrane protein
MNQLRQKLVMLCFAIISILFLFPSQSLALDYSITDVKIDAYLQENGNVDVKETHTYDFIGEFNGITREIIPKNGTSITEFKANENENPLRIEKKNDLYLIHRKGIDETITIQLRYSIENGVDLYSDIADFYWPFFDKRNESTYENLQVTVHPPKETFPIIAFGYDEAFKTEKVLPDGSVRFQFGEVPYETNGDIRVGYEPALFPGATLKSNKPMKDEISRAKQDLLDEAQAAAERKEKLSNMAKAVISVYTIILLLLMISTLIKSQIKKAAVQREMPNTFFIPKQIMSLPATILYTNSTYLPAERMAAGLMDLVRKGYIKKTEENHFKMENHLEKPLKHERILLDFLFQKVGSNGEFSFDDLSKYTKRVTNHAKYQTNQFNWGQAVHEEIKENELYEKSLGYRWTIGLSSILLLPLIVLFLTYSFFAWFAFTLVFFFVVIIYACFYRPKTWKGLSISYEWNSLKEHLKEWNVNEWKDLPEDDKMRAYIYGLGIRHKDFMKNSEKIVNSFEVPPNQSSYPHGAYSPVDFATIAYFGPMASTHFYSAQQRTASSLNSSSTNSSSSSGGGGGTGGGGGGSGAF